MMNKVEHKEKREKTIVKMLRHLLKVNHSVEYKITNDNDGNYSIVNCKNDRVVAYGDIENIWKDYTNGNIKWR